MYAPIMAVSMSKDAADAALQRSGRIALVVTLSLVGLAAIYYSALYLLAQ